MENARVLCTPITIVHIHLDESMPSHSKKCYPRCRCFREQTVWTTCKNSVSFRDCVLAISARDYYKYVILIFLLLCGWTLLCGIPVYWNSLRADFRGVCWKDSGQVLKTRHLKVLARWSVTFIHTIGLSEMSECARIVDFLDTFGWRVATAK